MTDCSFLELREKIVINVVDGKKLGHICDMLFTLKGKINAIIVPAERRFFKASSCDTICIPWCNICKIGQDTILVELKSSSHTPHSGSCGTGGGSGSPPSGGFPHKGFGESGDF